MTIGITSAVVYLKFSNAQFINFTNMLLKNDSNTPLSPEVSWENIEKRANYLKKKNFNLLDVLRKENFPTFYIMGEEIQLNLDNLKKGDSVYISSIEHVSAEEIIVRIVDDTTYSHDYSWLSIFNNIDCKECIIDDVGCEYAKYFQFIWYEGTHIIKKEDKNFHYDYFSPDNYENLIEGNIYPIHFGLLMLYKLNNDLFNLNIEFEWLKEGERYNELLKMIKQKENEIEIMKNRLSKIFKVENNNNFVETLKKSEWSKFNYNNTLAENTKHKKSVK